MKASVRFYDEFEGDDLTDIHRQVLDYLQNVVDQQDLEAFRIRILDDISEKTEWKSSALDETYPEYDE